MIRTKIIFVFLLVLFVDITSQTKIDIEIIKSEFESFNYNKVIQLSENLLNNDLINIIDDQKVDIYLMKGISHFSINEKELARKSFINILNIKSSFIPDRKRVSPKIISFFESIKKDFDVIIEKTKSSKVEEPIQNSSNFINERYLDLQKELLTSSVTKSILLPGLGHLNLDDDTKGWFLTGISSSLLILSVYYIVETNSKESDYLTANKQLVEEKYDDYNSAYKIRNALITSYIVVWLYSQIDLLFNSDEIIKNKIETDFKIGLDKFGKEEYKLSFKLNL